MRRHALLRHEFVEYVPDHLEEGVLYVSIPFATVIHSCFCGCGSEVVTPLSPTDWQLMFDGKTVSLDPSIGSWNLACQSHYWIRNNRVEWSRRWSRREIEMERARDRRAKQDHFASGEVSSNVREERKQTVVELWRKVKKRWF